MVAMALVQARGTLVANDKSGGLTITSGSSFAATSPPSRASFCSRFPPAVGGRARAGCIPVLSAVGGVRARAPITFHVGETSLTLPFSPEAAKGLNAAIDELFLTFKAREKTTRLQRLKNMEFRQTGENGVFFEVFCNPNAYSNAFQAKVLISINDEKIKIASEGPLSALKADLDEYVLRHV